MNTRQPAALPGRGLRALAATPPGQEGGPPPFISQGRALADAGYW
jgi:hypothetical protein